MILYEYPFNENIRTMLRLEHLLDRLGQLLPREAAIDHHFALVTLFEILDVSARADLKSELLKELERHRSQFTAYRGNPNVSQQALDEITARLDHAFDGLSHQYGKAAQLLTGNEWLMSVRSRISIPGGTCEFDLPAYYAWQQRSGEQRRADLAGWISALEPLAASLQVLLQLLRDAGVSHKVVTTLGQYQQGLPPGRTYQLLRLRIDPTSGLIPEITGHRLMVSVRMMRCEPDGRLRPVQDDTSFELTFCG